MGTVQPADGFGGADAALARCEKSLSETAGAFSGFRRSQEGKRESGRPGSTLPLIPSTPSKAFPLFSSVVLDSRRRPDKSPVAFSAAPSQPDVPQFTRSIWTQPGLPSPLDDIREI